MTWFPLDGLVPQATVSGEQANGYVWKFYESGTLTPLAMATDSTGATTSTEFVADTQGYPTLSGNIIVPHAQVSYKAVLYKSQADADADNTANAAYAVDALDVGLPTGSISLTDLEKITAGNIIVGQTLANAQVTPSGDLTMSELGAFTIANESVTLAKLSASLQTQISNSLTDFIDGLSTSINVTDSDHDIDVSTGSCSDSTTAAVMSVTSSTTSIDIAIGTGNGGFPSTSLTLAANTWYDVFVIAEADGGNATLGFDTDQSATNLLLDATANTPYTYTIYRVIGSVKTDGSENVYGYYQYGSTFIWADEFVDSTAVSATAAAATITSPLGYECEALMTSKLSTNSGGTTNCEYSVAPYSQPNTTLQLVNANSASNGANPARSASCFRVFTDTQSRIWQNFPISISGVSHELITRGFVHPRK